MYLVNQYKGWYRFTIFFILVDLARLQDVLPIQFIRPGLVTTICLLIYLTIYGWWNALRGRQELRILLFVCLLFCHIPFAKNNYWAYTVAKGMLLFVPFLFSLRVLLDNEKIFIHFLYVLSCVAGYVALYSLFHHGMGSGGWIEDENDVTLFFVLILPFVLFLFGCAESFARKAFVVMIILLILLGIVNSFSRGGFIGFILMCGTLWWFGKNKFWGVILLLIAMLIMFLFGGDQYVAEMSTVTDTTENTASDRLLTWEAGWSMFKDNPMGVGGGNFPIRFPEYQSDQFEKNMWGRAAHSLWFTLFPELGVPGTILYGMLICSNFISVFRLLNSSSATADDVGEITIEKRKLGVAFFASLIGFFGCATFISVLYYPYFWYLTILISAANEIFLVKPPVPA